MVEVQVFDKSFSIDEREQIIKEVNPHDGFCGVCLQTCNRLELYSGAGEVSVEHVEHLFRVVSGLESGLVGDNSIQGQVKLAYENARSRSKLSAELHKLFQAALFVGKRVRTETGISQGAMSHSQASVDILYELHKAPEHANITIIGVHNINENIVRYLVKREAKTIFIGNRTYEKALHLSEKYNIQIFHFHEIKERLANTDVLITATSSPHLIVYPEMMPSNKSMIIIDIAVPRDVDPSIGKMKGVHLINLDQVEELVTQNVEKRKDEVLKAQDIVQQEVVHFTKEMKRRRKYLSNKL